MTQEKIENLNITNTSKEIGVIIINFPQSKA